MSGSLVRSGLMRAGFAARAERYGVLSAVLFVAVLAVLALVSGGPAALAALNAVPAVVIPVMLAMSAANYALRAARWLLFSRAIGVDAPPAWNVIYYVAGFAMTTTPGKLGEALRLWLLRRVHGYRYSSTAGLLIGDRLSDAVSMTLVVAISVAWLADYIWVSIGCLVVASAMALLCLRPGLILRGVTMAYAVLRRRRRLFAAIRRAIRPLRKLASVRVFGLALLLGVLGWLSEGFSLWVLLHGMGVPVHPMTCIFVFSFSMIVGAVSVLPGGLGSTEATMVALLNMQAVPVQTAIVATAIIRLTTLWFAVGLGMAALPVAMRRARLIGFARTDSDAMPVEQRVS